MRHLIIKGYSLYVNASFYEVYETLQEAYAKALLYGKSNDTDILPMWGNKVVKEKLNLFDPSRNNDVLNPVTNRQVI